VPQIKNAAHLTGQVGSVVFVKGVGETDDPRMLAYFAEHSDRFVIVADQPAAETPEAVESVDDKPAEGDAPAEDASVSPYEELTDDELFEAYVTNVGDAGEAETRDDMIAALVALDGE
jgi:hypothetical protein